MNDNPSGEPMTVEQFKAALPAQMKRTVNQDLIDQINNTLSDPEMVEVFKDNLVTYANVLQYGKFKLFSFVNAVKYVSYKLLGSTNKDAYIRTFPDKYTRYLAEGLTDQNVSSYVSMYNRSKLVNLILEQTLVPTHILNAPIFQSAINAQAHLMMTAKSEKVRCDAANSLLVHLKRPESQKVELDIGVSKESIIDDYEKVMSRMVAKQKELIKAGGDVKQITNASIKTEESQKKVLDN